MTLPAQTLRLLPGTSHTGWAGAGTEFIVMDGAVRLVEVCRGVADQAASRVALLESGSHHRVEDAGWITLSAAAGGDVRVAVPPASVTLEFAWHALRRIIGFLREPARVPRA